MGDLKKVGNAVVKPFKEVGKAVGGVGQDIIDITVKPVRDLAISSQGAVRSTVDGIGEAASGLGEGIGGVGKGLGNLAQSEQFQGMLTGMGQNLLGLTPNAFSAPQPTQASPQYVGNSGMDVQQSNSMLPIILIGAVGVGAIFLLTKKR